MKQETKIFDYDGIVKIYIPSTIDEDRPAKELQTVWTKKALSYMCDCFGGATYYSAVGAWKNDAGEVITEDQNIVYSLIDGSNFDAFRKVEAFAKIVCKEMHQNCVLVEYCGKSCFVKE